MDYIIDRPIDNDRIMDNNYKNFQFYQLSKTQVTLCSNEEKTQKCSVVRKNLIIWDWDDTIFPTYAFRTHQDMKGKDFMHKLVILISYIEQIFNKMIELYGSSNIIIVTNGSPKWINKCLNVDIIQKQFMNFQKILKQNKIETISASTNNIRSKYPTNHYKWKQVVFEEYFQRHFVPKQTAKNEKGTTINCITSIGDSLCEYKASDLASRHMENRILNRIKFKSNPSIHDMICQLKDLLTMIDDFGNNMYGIEINYSYLTQSSYSDSTSC